MMLLALILVVVLSAAGSVALLAGRAETLIAANFRQSTEGLYAAEGAAAAAIQSLAGLPDWSAALASYAVFTDGAADGPKNLPGRDPFVLCCGATSVTADLQRRADPGLDWGPDTPLWRLYTWGPVDGWAGAPGRSPYYSVAWIADDPGDGDGSPLTDDNGVLQVIGVALGPGGARRSVRALVGRARSVDGEIIPGAVRILSWRESRW